MVCVSASWLLSHLSLCWEIGIPAQGLLMFSYSTGKHQLCGSADGSHPGIYVHHKLSASQQSDALVGKKK